jgi:hypothetical protein
VARVEVFATGVSRVDGDKIADRLRTAGLVVTEQRTSTEGDTVAVTASDVETVRAALGSFATAVGVKVTLLPS